MILSSRRRRSWRYTRAGPRCWSGSSNDINHPSHADRAMRCAEIGVGTRQRKGVLVNRACAGKGTPAQLVLSGEQNCPSAVHGLPLVTLWPPLAQVHRTVSPAVISIWFGTNANPCPTVTSTVWLVVDGRPLGTACPFRSTILIGLAGPEGLGRGSGVGQRPWCYSGSSRWRSAWRRTNRRRRRD